MSRIYRRMPLLIGCLALVGLLSAGGCCTTQKTPQMHLPMQEAMPRELSKVVLPTYTIEPPDILLIDEVHLVPRSPYRLRSQDVVRITAHRGPSDILKEGDTLYVQIDGIPLNTSSYHLREGDVLQIRASGVLPDLPIDGQFQVQPDGSIQLRATQYRPLLDSLGRTVQMELAAVEDYGPVMVEGKTIEEAEQAIQEMLAERFKQVKVIATLFKEPTPLEGPFAVHRANGAYEVVLPLPYGRVAVTGMTVAEAEKAVEERVREFLYQPIVVAILATAVPINGAYLVEIGGRIDLNNPTAFPRTAGAGVGAMLHFEAGALETAERSEEPPGTPVFYEPIEVAGLSVEEAEQYIENLLEERYFKDVEVAVTLEQSAAKQQVQGDHLVGPDGTVVLGTYGSVPVVGLTLAQAKAAIEHHLSQFFQDPEVSVDVWAYNSKVYYVITQGAGLGDGIFRFPITGNETVLDAISQINGLQEVSSKRIWIARPTPQPGQVQVLPVSWEAITAQASTGTNYQVLPGDRVFIAEDKLVALDTGLAKFIAPVERIMGFTLLGAGVATRLSGPVLKGGGNRQSRF